MRQRMALQRGAGLVAGLAAFAGMALSLAMPAFAQQASPLPRDEPQAHGISTPRLQRLDRFMREATSDNGYLGGVLLVARDGRIVAFDGYGHQDLARRVPMRSDAIFRIYSMSKTVTTVAVMMLVEEGRLRLGDAVADHLPGFAEPMVLADGAAPRPAKRKVTIHDLLTHTAGYPAGLPGDAAAMRALEAANPRAAHDLAGYAQRMAGVPLAADPGTRFGYEAAALDLSARIVEVVSGMPFERFLQERLFAPLQMPDTSFRVPEAQRARVADITVMGADGKLERDDGPSAREPGSPLNAYTSGAGGLYSTAGDYARLAQMLLNGGSLDGTSILGRKTVELMLRNHLTMLDPPVQQFSDAEGFGLGGYVVLDPARRGVPGSVGQFGWPGAASTTYFIDPQERLLAILMLQHLPNGASNDLPRLSRNFHALVYQALAQ